MEFQLRAILVTYRAELRRGLPMHGFRHRARQILDVLEAETRDDPELQACITPVRDEVLNQSYSAGKASLFGVGLSPRSSPTKH